MLRQRLVLLLWGAVSGLWVLDLARGLPDLNLVVIVTFGGVFLADTGSYVFHYLIDHYGDPLRGGLVQEFQRHHLIPQGIVEKPVMDVLYPGVRVVLPLMALLYLPLQEGWLSAVPALLLFVMMTCAAVGQMCHRWAHTRASLLVRAAQRMGLLLTPRAHCQHHRQPFESRFAVITGWSNRPLDAIGAPLLLDRLMCGLGYRKRGLVRSLGEISTRES
jgi:sterol desaturase/sphingolipid hydroxylase (fatty acid hydroxylase superfamily)